jgi:hypothetical protein
MDRFDNMGGGDSACGNGDHERLNQAKFGARLGT